MLRDAGSLKAGQQATRHSTLATPILAPPTHRVRGIQLLPHQVTFHAYIQHYQPTTLLDLRAISFHLSSTLFVISRSQIVLGRCKETCPLTTIPIPNQRLSPSHGRPGVLSNSRTDQDLSIHQRFPTHIKDSRTRSACSNKPASTHNPAAITNCPCHRLAQ